MARGLLSWRPFKKRGSYNVLSEPEPQSDSSTLSPVMESLTNNQILWPTQSVRTVAQLFSFVELAETVCECVIRANVRAKAYS